MQGISHHDYIHGRIFTHINKRVYIYAFVIIIGLESVGGFIYTTAAAHTYHYPRGISRVHRWYISGRGEGFIALYSYCDGGSGADRGRSVVSIIYIYIYVHVQGAGTWGSPPEPPRPTHTHYCAHPRNTPPRFQQSRFHNGITLGDLSCGAAAFGAKFTTGI